MTSIKIPEALREEHEELFSALNRYARLHDSTGTSIRTLLDSLEPHFAKEDETAMPLLGLISEAAMGLNLRDYSSLSPLYERLRTEYESMFEEHAEIKKCIEDARAAAKTERHRSVCETLDALEHHARVEEEVLYPAALLVGATVVAARVAITR